MLNEQVSIIPALPYRAYYALIDDGILTLQDLLENTEQQILDINGIGLGTLRKIKKFLFENGLHLFGDPSPKKCALSDTVDKLLLSRRALYYLDREKIITISDLISTGGAMLRRLSYTNDLMCENIYWRAYVNGFQIKNYF